MRRKRYFFICFSLSASYCTHALCNIMAQYFPDISFGWQGCSISCCQASKMRIKFKYLEFYINAMVTIILKKKKKKKKKPIFCWKTGSQFTPKFLEGLCDWKTANGYPKWELLIQQTMILDKNTIDHSRFKMICMRPNQSLFPEAPVHCTKRYKILMVPALFSQCLFPISVSWHHEVVCHHVPKANVSIR